MGGSLDGGVMVRLPWGARTVHDAGCSLVEQVSGITCPKANTGNQMTIQEAFCAHYQCSVAQFPERAFRLCLYSHAVPVALVLGKLNPALFREDRQVIEQLGLARDLDEVDAALSDFQYVNQARPHWLRTGFKVRLSGRKLRMLAVSLLGKEERLRATSAMA